MGKYNEHYRFKSHRNLTQNQVLILKKAFEQINDNLDLVKDYYTMPKHQIGRDGKCISKKLKGDTKLKTRAKKGLREKTGSLAAVTQFTPTIVNRITFDWDFLNACYNSWHVATTKEEKDCAISELAATIIHEASHTCLSNEKYAYLVGHYYRWRFRQDNGYTCPMCIASTMPPSWYPQDYKDKDAVIKHVRWCGIRFEEFTYPEGAIDPASIVSGVGMGFWYLSC